MAGAFGFEREHYGVSMDAGERVLLPAIRALSPGALVVADGFSCREQIAHATDRRGLHLAEVLHLALRQGAGQEVPDERPESDYWGRARIPPLDPPARAGESGGG
jgi:hypothetical protein